MENQIREARIEVESRDDKWYIHLYGEEIGYIRKDVCDARMAIALNTLVNKVNILMSEKNTGYKSQIPPSYKVESVGKEMFHTFTFDLFR